MLAKLELIESEDAGAFLNVEQSACGRRWVRTYVDGRMAQGLAQQLDIPLVAAELLLARGQDVQSAALFLNPKLRDAMPDPFRLKDMRVAAERFADALEAGERIAVFGDYDVDGGTSAALLMRFARACGSTLTLYVPDRIAEGYGPNVAAMEQLTKTHSLIVTVDCGMAAIAPLAAAKAAGADVIVLDHHAAQPQLPEAVAIVNANRLDEGMTAQLGHCAAVGIVFLFTVAVNSVLRARNSKLALPKDTPMAWLDLVALGTVADVVPLHGLNRAFVCQGLKIMAERRNAGLVALEQVAQLKKAPDSRTLGFAFGPRVNAGGRIGSATLGATLLSTDDTGEAKRIAEQLEAYNGERKALEAAVQAEAIKQLEDERANAPRNMAFAVGEGWHPGVIGIVAARLKDRFHRPSFVIAVNEEGIGKGSGRSLRGIDLGALTIAAQQQGLLIAGGGHAMAAGLTVAKDKIPALQAFFEDRLEGLLTPEIIRPKLVIDGLLSIAGANDALMDQVERFAPYGTGNPEPMFALTNLTIASARTMGGDNTHVMCEFTDDSRGRMRGVAFGCAATALGKAILSGPRQVSVAGKLQRDEYNGQRRVQIMIEDICAL